MTINVLFPCIACTGNMRRLSALCIIHSESEYLSIWQPCNGVKMSGNFSYSFVVVLWNDLHIKLVKCFTVHFCTKYFGLFSLTDLLCGFCFSMNSNNESQRFKQQRAKFHPRILSTKVSYHIYASHRFDINVRVTTSVLFRVCRWNFCCLKAVAFLWFYSVKWQVAVFKMAIVRHLAFLIRNFKDRYGADNQRASPRWISRWLVESLLRYGILSWSSWTWTNLGPPTRSIWRSFSLRKKMMQ